MTEHWWLAPLITAAIVGSLLWVLEPLAYRWGLLDHPGGRKGHEHPTPIIGGLAMAIGIMAPVLYSGNYSQSYLGFVIGGAMLVIVGLIDDARDVRWWIRLLVQALAALAMIYIGGVRVEYIGPLFGFGNIDLGIWSVPFTVLATVGVINAFNMSDGVDGLAGLLAVAALTMYCAAAVYSGNTFVVDRLASVIAAVGVFLAFNMRHPWRERARVFMGDAGSGFLGYLIAWVCFRLTQTPGHPVSPVLAPWLIAPPIVDCLVLIVRRLREGRSPFAAGRDHLHHFLLDAGFTPTQVALGLAAVSYALGLSAALALKTDNVPETVLVLAFGALTIGYYWLTIRRERAIAFFARLRLLSKFASPGIEKKPLHDPAKRPDTEESIGRALIEALNLLDNSPGSSGSPREEPVTATHPPDSRSAARQRGETQEAIAPAGRCFNKITPVLALTSTSKQTRKDTMHSLQNCRIAIVGLGYVGLPLAVEFGKHFQTIGFDINSQRIGELRAGHDSTLEVESAELAASSRLRYSDVLSALHDCNVFIVTVPTPIDAAKRPDLTPLIKASESLGRVLKRGDIVIYESTVYPGCTEEVCVPLLEKISGLKFNQDFFAGYSPERINPGDKQHRVANIRKVTSGSTPEAADFVDRLYASIVTVGTHKASSIRVAEAAKVIENTQRDLNIALVNELAVLFGKLGIDTLEVLEAAGTKWNFLPFRPGLVGGHCISVDPYYLTHKAQEIGHHTEVILAGRRINDSMGAHVAGEVIKLMASRRINPVGARVLVMGLAFKENCPDLRNTRVVDIVQVLRGYHAQVDIYDPWVDAEEAAHEYDLHPISVPDPGRYDAVVIAVGHRQFQELGAEGIRKLTRAEGVVYDVKYVLPREAVDGRL